MVKRSGLSGAEFGTHLGKEHAKANAKLNTPLTDTIEQAEMAYVKTLRREGYQFRRSRLWSSVRLPNMQWPGFALPSTMIKWLRTIEVPSPAILIPKRKKLAVAATALFAMIGVATAGVFVVPQTMESATAPIIDVLLGDTLADPIHKEVLCQSFNPLTDKNQSFIGLMPNTVKCAPHQMAVKVIDKNDLDVIVPALEAVEGKYYGSGVFHNVSIKGIMRSAKSQIIGGTRVGGSILPQSNLELVMAQGGRLSFGEKLAHLIGGLAYSARYLRSKEQRDSFAASYGVCAIGLGGTSGGFGYPLSGQACAAIFGKDRIRDLSQAQACLIAVSFKRPIRVPGNKADADDIRRYIDQIKGLKERAQKRCASALTLSDLEKQKLKAKIETVSFVSPDKLLKQVSSMHVNRNLAQAVSDVTLGQGASQTSLQYPTQKQLVHNVGTYISGSVVPNLNPQLCSGPTCPAGRRVEYGFMIAELVENDLKIRAIAQNRARLITGPRTGKPTRSTASLNKAFILPLLQEAGISRLCKQKWANLHDDGGYAGSNCRSKKDWISLRAAFAQSSNLALAFGLRKIGIRRLKEMFNAIGYHYDASLSKGELVRGFVVGNRFAIRPTDYIANIAAMSFGNEKIAQPQIEFQNSNRNGTKLFFSKSSLRKTIPAMTSPITTAYGTARAASPILKRAGCKVRFAKTGTSETAIVRDGIRDKFITIAAICGGKKLIGYAQVGSPSINVPVGRLTADPLVRMLAKTIVQAAN